LNIVRTHGIYISQTNTSLYKIFMKKIVTLIVMLLISMLPALTPVHAESHAKAADTATDEEKKPAEEDEEPECD